MIWKPIAWFVFACILCLAAPALSVVQFNCGFEEGGGGGGPGGSPFPPGSSANVKFIYVAFPGDVDSLLTDAHAAVLDTLQWYWSSHSHGDFEFSADSEVVLKPGESFEDQDPPSAWVAQLAAQQYVDFDPIPSGYFYADSTLQSWWGPVEGYASPLAAEILYKIMQEYTAVGDTTLFDDTDALIMLFLTQSNPFDNLIWNGVRGRPAIFVRWENLPDFFAGIPASWRLQYEDYLQGTCQVAYLHAGTDSINTCHTATVVAHEFGHILGADDGPPTLLGGWSEGVYYYGTRNLMFQHTYPDEGIPPVVPGWYQDFGWNEVVDFTGQNLKDVWLWDIRTDLGQIYKFRLDDPAQPDSVVADQHFLFAYHAGTGIEAIHNPQMEPLMRATGLEIWHCIGEQMFDLESAFGLFSDPGDTIFALNGDNWQQPDTEQGYDNHDWWSQPGGFQRSKYEYGDYIGDEFDFFDLSVRDTLPILVADEFSYRTNPNCFWYNEFPEEPPLRRQPQNISNSLFVRVLEENQGMGYMRVDFITAPYGEVIYPNGGESFDPDRAVIVRWTNEFDAAIDAVDILFSRLGGAAWDTVETGYAVEPDDSTYVWTPIADDATSDGKIKVLFHNPYSGYVPESESEGVFTVTGEMDPAEMIVTPNGGESFFAGLPLQIRWTNYFASHPDPDMHIEQVDLEFSADGGASWDTVGTDIAYEIDPITDENYFDFTPTAAEVTAQGRVKLTFHNHGGDSGSDESEGDFKIYPLGAAYADSSSAATVDYHGVPYSAIALDYNQDQKHDLFVTVQDDNDDPEAEPVLFENIGIEGGGPKFEMRNDDAFPFACRPQVGSFGLTAGDYDLDGDEDVFVAHQTNPRLYNFDHQGNEQFVDLAADSSVFAAAAFDTGLTLSMCGTWVDYDHDGDLDLHVGRAEVSGPGGGDRGDPAVGLLPKNWTPVLLVFA